MKTILIAIPIIDYIEVETFKSIYDLEVPPGYKIDFEYVKGTQIDQIRNLIAEWAKRYDYLFSVDSDMIIPKNALTKMLDADKDIVTGLYIQRIPGTHTLEVYMVDPTGGLVNIPYDLLKHHHGLVEIAGCGFGCVLVKGDVFRKMEYPHFYYQSALDHKNTVSEDVYFCKKARDLNFKVWVDTTIHCDHKGSTLFKINTQTQPLTEHIIIEQEEIVKPTEHKRDTGITVIPDSYKNERIFK